MTILFAYQSILRVGFYHRVLERCLIASFTLPLLYSFLGGIVGNIFTVLGTRPSKYLCLYLIKVTMFLLDVRLLKHPNTPPTSHVSDVKKLTLTNYGKI